VELEDNPGLATMRLDAKTRRIQGSKTILRVVRVKNRSSPSPRKTRKKPYTLQKTTV
jgi:hypothetical protein